MTSREPLPGEAGGVPYDQEKDWGFEQWTGAQPVDATAAHESQPTYKKRIHAPELVGSTVVASAIVLVLVVSNAFSSNSKPKPRSGGLQPVPAQLPEAVKRQYDAVIKVNNSSGSGSGVKVGQDMALTAGHMVMQEGPGHPSSLAPCLASSNVETVNNWPGYSSVVTNWFGEYNGPHGANEPDFALLQIEPDPAFEALPTVSIATKPFHKGDTAYFINYQSFANGNGNRAPGETAFGDAYYTSTAAEYAGIVVGYEDGQYVIANGLQGYGARRDRQSNPEPGFSGGPVMNSQGQLEGLSVDLQYKKLLVGNIDSWYNVRLPLDPNKRAGLSYIQPVNQALLENAEAQLGAPPNCD